MGRKEEKGRRKRVKEKGKGEKIEIESIKKKKQKACDWVYLISFISLFHLFNLISFCFISFFPSEMSLTI